MKKQPALKATGAVIAIVVMPLIFGWWLAEHPYVANYALRALGLLFIVAAWRMFYRIFKVQGK